MRYALFIIVGSALFATGGRAAPATGGIAVLDFELVDLTLDARNFTELERTASIKPMLEKALIDSSQATVAVEPAAQRAADKGVGYLFDHADVAAALGRSVGAKWVVVGRVHKPSFLFAYLKARLIDVASSEQVAELVVEVKGPQKELTQRGVKNLAQQIVGTAESAEIAQWQAERAASLRSESGWLTLVGLFWLEEGEATLGSGPQSAIRLQNPQLARAAGSFLRKGSVVRFVARGGGGITHEGRPATSLELAPDTTANPTVLESASLSFTLIERAGHYGIRVRDKQSPVRLSFKGLEYFPVSTDWVFDARFEPYEAKRSITIVNVLGMEQEMECPGAIGFTKNGRQYRLDAVLEEPGARELFVIFADQTSGKETYGAGRFVYIDLPVNGTMRLDFNKAYNPPCAFSNFSTCPLPPPQNRLALRVEAGEKTYANPVPANPVPVTGFPVHPAALPIP